MMQQDGTGKGYWQKVNSENMAMVKAVVETLTAHSVHQGYGYSAVADDAAAAAGEYTIWLQNDSDTRKLVISGIVLFSKSADVVWKLHSVTGTGDTAAAITPLNENLDSGRTADFTCRGGA